MPEKGAKSMRVPCVVPCLQMEATTAFLLYLKRQAATWQTHIFRYGLSQDSPLDLRYVFVGGRLDGSLSHSSFAHLLTPLLPGHCLPPRATHLADHVSQVCLVRRECVTWTGERPGSLSL